VKVLNHIGDERGKSLLDCLSELVERSKAWRLAEKQTWSRLANNAG